MGQHAESAKCEGVNVGFRWRRRNEGFEWRTYVRTTILLKRERRRRKAEDVKAAAVFGIKQAGQRSADAANGHLKSLEQRGKLVVQGAGRRIRRGLLLARDHAASAGLAALQYGSAAAAAGGNLMSNKLKHAQGALTGRGQKAQGAVAGQIASAVSFTHRGMSWIGQRSGRNRRTTATAALALSALGVAVYRASHLGAKQDLLHDTAIVALLTISAAATAALLIERWFANRDTGPVTMAKGAVAVAGAAASRAARSRVELPIPAVALGVTALAAVAFWRPSIDWPSMSMPNWSHVASFMTTKPVTVNGTATAISGDTLRIGDVSLRLDGIEAPGTNQTCLKPDLKTWKCAENAKTALASALRRKQVTCSVMSHTGDGYPIARCTTAGNDFVADLVRSGSVFATGGLLSLYGAQEIEAKTLRAGIWLGEAKRPAEWREARWEEAKRKAPSGCPIKGKVLSRTAKIYMLPWSSRYEQARVDERRGERWFCSEVEAQDAGWKPSQKS